MQNADTEAVKKPSLLGIEGCRGVPRPPVCLVSLQASALGTVANVVFDHRRCRAAEDFNTAREGAVHEGTELLKVEGFLPSLSGASDGLAAKPT